MAKKFGNKNKGFKKPYKKEIVLNPDAIRALVSHVHFLYEDTGMELRHMSYKSLHNTRLISFYDKADDEELFSVIMAEDGVSLSSGKTPVNFSGKNFQIGIIALAEKCYYFKENDKKL